MPIISKPLFIYLQRPDTGEWVTVGRYLAGAPGRGSQLLSGKKCINENHTTKGNGSIALPFPGPTGRLSLRNVNSLYTASSMQ